MEPAGEGFRLPRGAAPKGLGDVAAEPLWLGQWHGEPCWVVGLPATPPRPPASA